MIRIKTFVLNLRDVRDRYLRLNFEKIEDKFNEIDDALGENSGTSSTTIITNGGTNITTELQSNNIEEKIPQANISALKLVRANGPETILTSNPNGTYFESVVFGVIVRTGIAGVLAPVQVFGELEDPFLDFPLNDTLYLDSDGSITNIAPNTNFLTIIGYSLGSGTIFINIQEPIQLA